MCVYVILFIHQDRWNPYVSDSGQSNSLRIQVMQKKKNRQLAAQFNAERSKYSVTAAINLSRCFTLTKSGIEPDRTKCVRVQNASRRFLALQQGQGMEMGKSSVFTQQQRATSTCEVADGLLCGPHKQHAESRE